MTTHQQMILAAQIEGWKAERRLAAAWDAMERRKAERDIAVCSQMEARLRSMK